MTNHQQRGRWRRTATATSRIPTTCEPSKRSLRTAPHSRSNHKLTRHKDTLTHNHMPTPTTHGGHPTTRSNLLHTYSKDHCQGENNLSTPIHSNTTGNNRQDRT